LATASLILLAGFAGLAHAQTPAIPKKFHNDLRFNLPFQLGDADRAALREVHLYVKHGAENWVCVEKALPTKKAFSFKAPQDGEYWFSIATVDQTGKATPADVSREPPCLIVVVDTQSPKIELSLLPGAGSGAVVRCEVKDANPEPTKLKVEYQTNDQSWHPLMPVAMAADLYAIPDEKSWTGSIRAETRDKANNVGQIESNLKAADAVAVQPSANPVLEPDKGSPPEIDLPPSEPMPTPKPVEIVSKKPVVDEKPQADHQLINSTHAELAYQLDQVGPSGVGKVEVWMTADQGKSWKKLCEDKKHKSPVEFDLPGEGLYGLSLVVTNGYGMGDPPPAQGDQPDTWIEVDTTKPEAQLLAVRPVLGDKSGALHISWSAKDKNLGACCISLSFAATKEGPWMPIAKGLNNDGSFKWSVPREAGAEFFVRLEVCDKAGNKSLCESPDKIVMDMSRPKAKVIGVTAKDTHKATTPTGN
jgi:hypothetical protein